MFSYFLEVEVKRYKTAELLDCFETFIGQFRNEPGCLDYRIYQDCNRADLYRLVGEWETYRDMSQHLCTEDLKIVLGAVKVLGTTSRLCVTENVSLEENN